MKTRAVDFNFSGSELTIHGADPTHGEADEVVTFEGSIKKDFKTRINSDFLQVLLRKLDGDMIISLPKEKRWCAAL